MNTKKVGDSGEAFAAEYLAGKGLSILERNYRTPMGEIDLIAQDGRELVFVEVKTRKSERYGQPALAVGPEKQRRILRAAVWYTSKRQGELPPCRFDVVEVYAPEDGAWSLRHLEGAFEAQGL
ncbi:MAG: YraN family protein [Schwartzia sp.]|nr:YraN family protein [Schwartzia sp. (in: firmicutes)]